MADGVQSLVIGHSDQLSQNKFFDPRTPSKRNIEPPAKSKMAARGHQNGRRGLERGAILGYSNQLLQIKFLDQVKFLDQIPA